MPPQLQREDQELSREVLPCIKQQHGTLDEGEELEECLHVPMGAAPKLTCKLKRAGDIDMQERI